MGRKGGLTMDSKKKKQLIEKGNGWVHRDIISVEVYERNGRVIKLTEE